MGADLGNMQLTSKFSKIFKFLLCIIDIYSKDACVIPLKDKKCITITDAVQKVLDDSNRKPNKTWGDKCSEFYNRRMKSWLKKGDIEMYSIYNEGKSAIAESFIRILKTKFINTWL